MRCTGTGKENRIRQREVSCNHNIKKKVMFSKCSQIIWEEMLKGLVSNRLYASPSPVCRMLSALTARICLDVSRLSHKERSFTAQSRSLLKPRSSEAMLRLREKHVYGPPA